jgi:hypothetical protein
MIMGRNARILAGLLLAAILGTTAQRLSMAQPPSSEKGTGGGSKPSGYAPAGDLADQMDSYLDRLSEALASQSDYDEAKQSRVLKDANTLAALALVLGMHDEPSKYRDSAPAIIKGAQTLADKNEDFAAAAKALADIKQSAAGSGKTGELVWGDVAALSSLMKQVPVVNGGLKRSLDPARFKKLSKGAAEQSATLAALAQAAIFDTSAVADPSDEGRWKEFCIEMRDAAGAVNAAAHALDQPAAAAAHKRLAKSCDICHAVFRKE